MDYRDISLAMENELQERIERETSYYDEDDWEDDYEEDWEDDWEDDYEEDWEDDWES